MVTILDLLAVCPVAKFILKRKPLLHVRVTYGDYAELHDLYDVKDVILHSKLGSHLN